MILGLLNPMHILITYFCMINLNVNIATHVTFSKYLFCVVKQLVYSLKNTMTVHDVGIILRQHVTVYPGPSSGQRTYTTDAVSMYCVLWDPILLNRVYAKGIGNTKFL